jgi:hypothetical protein
MSRIRVALGILLILGFVIQGLWLSALMMPALIRAAVAGKDPFARGEMRLRVILKSLPARGVYGYQASGPLKIGKNQEVEGDNRSISRYVLAQYTLAPRILDLGPGRPIVIHDDSDPVRVTSGEDR